MNDQEMEVINEDTYGEVLTEEKRFEAKGCQYRQRGPYIVCVSCEVQHAIYIGMDKLMVSEDSQGNPIFEKRNKQV